MSSSALFFIGCWSSFNHTHKWYRLNDLICCCLIAVVKFGIIFTATLIVQLRVFVNCVGRLMVCGEWNSLLLIFSNVCIYGVRIWWTYSPIIDRIRATWWWIPICFVSYWKFSSRKETNNNIKRNLKRNEHFNQIFFFVM